MQLQLIPMVSILQKTFRCLLKNWKPAGRPLSWVPAIWTQENMPGKNSFGNKFSNFWFRVETGIRCPDTQTGYRLYPVRLMKDMRFFTRKYEFEIEVLVRSAWKGIKLEWVPVSVYYAPKETRITHFRPFKDFFRISILNTILVLIAFLYIKPRDFFRAIFQKNWKDTLKEHLFNPAAARLHKSTSVGFGIFMGIIPIWGFQLLVAIALSIVLRLNKTLVIIAANISMPPMIPLIIFLSYKMGAVLDAPKCGQYPFQQKYKPCKSIRINLLQYIYGSITLAIVAGIVFGLLTFILLKFFKRKPAPPPEGYNQMEKIFAGIYDYFQKTPHRVLYAVFFMSLGLFAFFALRVKFEEDISAIIPKDKKIEKLNEVFQNSKFADKLVITVSLKDTNAAAHRIAWLHMPIHLLRRLKRKSSCLHQKIHYKVDDDCYHGTFSNHQEHLPVFLNEKDYTAIDTLISPAKVKANTGTDIRTLTSLPVLR